MSGNRYLEGNYAPVTEEVTALDLEVVGTLPAHLDGRYLRNGPNPIGADPDAYHWFLGHGMVHGVRLRDGKAEWYRNRFVRNGDVSARLGEPARATTVAANGGPDFDASPNTNVIAQGGRTFAIVESGPRPYELTDELETIGACDFDGTLPGGYTAHPKLDAATGELHAMSYFWGWGNKVQYSVIGPDARVRRTVDIETTGSPMMHDCSLTERYVVIYDLPVAFDVDVAMAGGSFPYRWHDDYPARVGLLPRDGEASDVRWFDVEPCYVFHPMNAYDDGDDKVVLDVVRYEDMFRGDHMAPNGGASTLDRWTVDVNAGKVLEERLDDRGQELPRVDERLVGRRHRYGYAPTIQTRDDMIGFDSGLLRHDLVAGRTDERSFGQGSVPGEFVFVPNSVDSPEDDGVLLGFVYDAGRDASDLRVLDAATLDDVAVVKLPQRVPFGFHGNWVPSGQ